MKINNKGILLMSIVLVLTIVMMAGAEARLGDFPRGNCVDIKTNLNTSLVNISINYVNTSTAVLNQPMTKDGLNFNYTFCETQERGIYNYNYNDNEGNTYVNDFVISNIGDAISTGAAIVYIIVLIAVSLLLALFVWISWVTPFKNVEVEGDNATVILKVTATKYVKLIAMWISYGFFLWFLAIVTGLVNNYILFAELRRITTNLYSYLSILGYGVSVTITIILFVMLWKDILWNKEIRKHGKAFIEKNAGDSR